mmetsp:Transcript_72549/g.132605  ORF Transcript_72549/g.132605 Transcript_72549/m.132605 type:complete len:250 (-) Transcript_72549:31-780(-)
MAAVVASLAAFLTGCGLPIQAYRVAGDRDLCSEEARGCSVASQDRNNSVVWRIVSPANGLCNYFAAAPAGGTSQASAREDNVNEATPAPPARRVRFDLAGSTTHEVTPYSEVYGMHPRDFNFGRIFPAPAAGLCDKNNIDSWIIRTKAKVREDLVCGDSDDSDEEDDGFGHAAALQRLLGRAGSMGQKGCHSRRTVRGFWVRPCWLAVCVCCFMVRVFGMQACLELLTEVTTMPKELMLNIFGVATQKL